MARLVLRRLEQPLQEEAAEVAAEQSLSLALSQRLALAVSVDQVAQAQAAAQPLDTQQLASR